jgi:hypothetical protein
MMARWSTAMVDPSERSGLVSLPAQAAAGRALGSAGRRRRAKFQGPSAPPGGSAAAAEAQGVLALEPEALPGVSQPDSELQPVNILIKSIEAEYRRYKALAEGALAQVPEPLLSAPGPGNGNSLATICWHVAGNLQSRFTDFLTTDGEKAWRRREEEFVARTVSREALLAKWAAGWDVLLSALASLGDDDLQTTVTIRRQPLAVHEALHRSLAHLSYHVGQIVYLAHSLCGPAWRYLSIPPGGSDAVNAQPTFDTPLAHAKMVEERTRQS